MIQEAGKICYTPIGVVHSSFKESKGTPAQPVAAPQSIGKIEIFEQYCEGLTDLEGFSHLIVLFHMHLINKHPLKVIPFLDTVEHGVFATRSPGRPNPIGYSVVKLDRIENNILHVSGVDIIDNSPILDIKPYVNSFDFRRADKCGWFDTVEINLSKAKDDGRFS